MDKKNLYLGTIFFLLTATLIGAYAAVPQGTVRTTGGGITTYVGNFVNATQGYFVGTNQVITAGLDASFDDVDASGWVDAAEGFFIGGVNMTDDFLNTSVSKNSGANIGSRPVLNFIEGANITLTISDDAAGNEVDITIASSGGGGTGDVNGSAINPTNLNASGLYNFGTQFDANTTWSVNYSWVGNAMRVNCGENITAGSLVRFGAAGRTRSANANLDTHVPCVGMALEYGRYYSGSNGDSQLILFQGFVYNSAWNLTQGQPVFLGEGYGIMQQTAPSDSGDQVQVIGIAYTDTILYFNPDYTVLEIT